MTLHYRDMQLFMKRLRKSIKEDYGSTEKLKYYTCGEYGPKTERPHYHSIMFNLPEPLRTLQYDWDQKRWRCKPMEDLWELGHVHLGEVTGASIHYVTGYLQKSNGLLQNTPDDDRQRQKAWMSKGLGKSYITSRRKEYYRRKLLPYIVTAGGVKQSMPRYLAERIYTEKQLRRVKAKKVAHVEAYEFGDNYDYRLDRELKKDAIRKHHRKIREHNSGRDRATLL